MKFIKITVISAVAIFVFSTISTVQAQKLSSIAKPFSIRLPQTVDTKNLYITYYMSGTFGGYSNFINTKQNVWNYEIATSYEGKPARTLKVIVFCPGYKVKTFDIPSLARLKKWNYDIELETLQAVTLSGKVLMPDKQITEGLRLTVAFTPLWECLFFELPDCLLPFLEIASVGIAKDGTFSIPLPDFTSDPIVSSYKHSGGFRLFVGDVNNRFLFQLKHEKETKDFSELPLSAKYPPYQVFVAIPEK